MSTRLSAAAPPLPYSGATSNLRLTCMISGGCARYDSHSNLSFVMRLDMTRILKQAAAEPLASNNVITRGFMTRNILYLFQRALQQFRGNVGLWLEFATFSYSHASYRLLSEILSQALQFNPDCAGLWAFVAILEYRQRVLFSHEAPWCSVKGFLCWYWQGDISAARRLLLRGLRSCDYCPGIALVQSLAFSGNWHAQTYLALSQEYLRLELAYLINFEQRRLFLGIRDNKDFVNKAVWTCSVILSLLSFMFWQRSWQKAVARAIMSSAMLRRQGLHNINAPHFHMFWESQDIAIAGDRILYQQLIGIIQKPMVCLFSNFWAALQLRTSRWCQPLLQDEYISNILHELSSIDDVDGQNTQNDDSQNAGGENLQFWTTVVCSGDNINGTRCWLKSQQPSKNEAFLLCSKGPVVRTAKCVNMIDTLRLVQMTKVFLYLRNPNQAFGEEFWVSLHRLALSGGLSSAYSRETALRKSRKRPPRSSDIFILAIATAPAAAKLKLYKYIIILCFSVICCVILQWELPITKGRENDH